MKTIAITTKHQPATATRGWPVIVASALDINGVTRRLITGWRDYFNPEENHENAALNLLGKHQIAPQGVGVTLAASAVLRKGVRVHIYSPITTR